MASRRFFLLGSLVALPAGCLASGQGLAGNSLAPPIVDADRDIFKELGVRSFINAAGPYSSLSGAQVWPEVREAMQNAQRHTARIGDLHDAIGNRIAALTGADAAMVSAGATSATILGTSACLTGTDQEKIAQLPNLAGMKSEVIIQKGHVHSYARALRNCGVRVIPVETERELVNSINKRTVMLQFLYTYRNSGKITAERFVAIGQAHRISVFCDAATMIPPINNIQRIVGIGFDLVCFSGGKGLRGPYNGGLLLGRNDLITAARMNAAPHVEAIGRGMKVSKEVLVGILVALETSLKYDHVADRERKRGWLQYIGKEVGRLDGITSELVFTQSEFHPNLRLIWDRKKYMASPQQIKQALRQGEPSIEVVRLSLAEGNLEISAWTMEPGEKRIVAERIREVFTGECQTSCV